MDELIRPICRKSHLNFMQHNWKSMDDFEIGFHTSRICNEIDKAIENFRNGVSSYLSIACPPRQGKSQIVSRYLPSKFLGEFPDHNIISTTYSQPMAQLFSNQAKEVFLQPEYKEIYPEIKLDKQTADHWTVKHPDYKTEGNFFATSLLGGAAGKGSHMLIIDDYFKSREQSESQTMRDKIWDAFINDFMTRLAPTAIVIILATPWNINGPRQRIKNRMEEDFNFPKFKFITYPAKAEHYEGEGIYPGKYLFPERYSDDWYEQQYSTLGKYYASSLFDCSPTVRGGAILKTDNIRYHDSINDFPKKIIYARVYDLGHSGKRKGKKQGDPTGSLLLGFRKIGMNTDLNIPILELWIIDGTEFRENSPRRDEKIMMQIKEDGLQVPTVFESTLDSIDAVKSIRAKIKNIKKTHSVNVRKAKAIRIIPLEVVFEAGRVNLLKGTWNKRFIQQVEAFDGAEDGKENDEFIDCMSTAYEFLVKNNAKQKTANH